VPLSYVVPSSQGQRDERLNMAFNKSKHIDAAQKYLRHGKLPQAIGEYQQILKQEPKDQITLMTLGDLFVRRGETFQALEYFERLAKIFLNDGFTTKAIAIYKKIAKLAPEESRPLERLAELYVQQGVLSEARPLYLQLAEVQLKAGRQSQAAALLRRLLEAEPDNLRVQTRLGDLYLAMGQHKEAIEIFLGVAQRVLDRGEHAEAARLADRILEIDARHLPTLILKARALFGTDNRAEGASLLESLPEQDAGSEITTMLLEYYLDSGKSPEAAALAEKVFTRQPKNFALTHHVATVLLEAGDLDRAQGLLALVCNTMMESGEHEVLAQTFSRLAELRPGQLEPLEWLVELYGRVSDSFRLPDALAQLAQALEAAGNDTKALETYEQLLDRRPEDETTRRKYVRLRAKMGLEPLTGEISPPAKIEPTEAEAKPASPTSPEPALEEEIQRYVTQVLTDVDLFSSYGLTQKAIDLLETTLQRAPQHTPVLERLLDLSVGSGNDRRTVELAAMLEQIATERKDRAGVEKYAEFRRRFQRAAGLSAAEVAEPARSSTPAPAEFAVPTIEAVLDEFLPEAFPDSLTQEQIGFPAPVESAVHEVDLSDEWAALSQQLEGAVVKDAPEAPADASNDSAAATRPTQPEATVFAPEPPAFDLEPQPTEPVRASQNMTLSADALLADLATELESATSALGIPAEVEQHATPSAAQPPSVAIASPTGQTSASGAPASPVPAGSAPAGPLDDLFDEFRSELGEMGKDDEDLETHYNLGIAYREMGLLDEAISEFQKVAKASSRVPSFHYAMQCCTLLGLAFMEKGQPAIAVIWYERALQTPGLDQESILALRYDLGMAQELAGDKSAAFRTFSQVYAMNIDYRDVSERIALLGKTR
jgi:tetratricopeptide (TPR) repeat protein